MHILNNLIVADDIFEKKFICDLNKCKGACCIEGDSGAPLDLDEVNIIGEHLTMILPHLPEKNAQFIKDNNFNTIDEDGEYATQCLPTGECVFVQIQNGIANCTIEKLFFSGNLPFNKPISCHLYPIRIKKYGDYIALNYHHWDICNPACNLGINNETPVLSFLKSALVRRFGTETYEMLEAYMLSQK